MAARTSAAGDIDTTVATLKTQIGTYIALIQTTSPNDSPQVLVWTWLREQIRGITGMAQAVDTAPTGVIQTVVDKTLVQVDDFA